MRYRLIKDGMQINTIESDAVFVQHYCESNGLTYQEIPPSESTPAAPEPDALTRTQLAVAELAETEAAHDLENKLAIAELAETLLGGASNG